MPLIVKINVALRKHFCQKIGSERVNVRSCAAAAWFMTVVYAVYLLEFN